MAGGVRVSLAAVVFTDVVGSTELRSRFGDDVADEVRRSHDAALDTVVRAHNDRGVKNLGAGTTAVFPGAAAAAAPEPAEAALDTATGLGLPRVADQARHLLAEAECTGIAVTRSGMPDR